MDVEAGALLTISGNTVTTTANDVQDITGITIAPSPTALGPRKISGNTLSVIGSSDETSSEAIVIAEASPFAISGNKTLNFRVGIGIQSECASIDDTQITHNRVTDSGLVGIFRGRSRAGRYVRPAARRQLPHHRQHGRQHGRAGRGRHRAAAPILGTRATPSSAMHW